jgi:hypothetical protein
MGFFSKIKDNITHGGVKVHVQAPSSVPGNQVIPVTVTLTADSSQTITSVKAELKAQVREEGMMMGGGRGVSMNSNRSNYQTVAQVESRDPLSIGPGETKTVNLQLFLNGNGTPNPLGQVGNLGGALGGALQAVASVAQNLEHVSYLYSVHASAQVQGVSLDPSDKQPIQILPSAEANAPQAVQFAQPNDSMGAQVQPPVPQQTFTPEPSVPPVPPLQPEVTQQFDPNQQPPQQ